MSSSTFILTDHETWIARFFEIMGDLVTETVLDKLRANPPECFACDDSDWIDALIVHDGADLPSILMDRFTDGWCVVRAFHACRPADPDSYRDNGLKPQAISDYKANAVALGGRLGVRADQVCAACDQFDWREYAGQVFFDLRYDWLERQFNHCSRFGSEAIFGLLLPLCNRADLERLVQQSGTPTILECDVPARMIDPAYLRCLCGKIVAGSIQHRIDPHWIPDVTGNGIAIRSTLPPESIIKWHAPSQDIAQRSQCKG